MPLIDDLKAIAKVTVGGSAEYAVVSMQGSDEPHGVEGVAGARGRKVTWSLGCRVHVADAAAARDAETTLRAALATMGAAVTLTRRGTAITLPASGSGSRPGYPKTKVRSGARVGGWFEFTLDAETILDEVTTTDGAFEVVSHSRTTSIAVDIDGEVKTDVRGSVRVQAGEDARAMVLAQVIPGAKTAATAASKNFSYSTEQNDDATACTYSHTTGGFAQDFSGAVAFGETNDRTRSDPQGRRVRTVSGRATGAGATLYAQDKNPNEPVDPTLFPQGSEISLPSEPDGRVEFRYEFWQGFTPDPDASIDSDFGSAVLYSYNESVSESPGTAPINAALFFDGDPLLTRGPKRQWVYVVRTSIEFTGDWADALAGIGHIKWKELGSMAMPAEAPDNLVDTVPSRSSRGGLKTLTLTRTYMFAKQQELPEPREVLP